jgi:hypothetical protein
MLVAGDERRYVSHGYLLGELRLQVLQGALVVVWLCYVPVSTG